MANARDWRKGSEQVNLIGLTNISTVIGPKLDKLSCEINSRNGPKIKNSKPRRFLLIFSDALAPAVRKVDNAIHRINHYPVADSVVCFVNTYPDWIVIYPVDSVIQTLNNRGLFKNLTRNKCVSVSEITSVKHRMCKIWST